MDSAKLLIIIFIVALIILIAGAAIWFGWGGTGLKWYQARPKVNSGGTEIHRRV